MDDFKRLVKQAQGMGMRVIIDWVANHTAFDHRWTVEHKDWVFAFRCERDGNRVRVTVNLSGAAQQYSLPGAGRHARWGRGSR